MRVSKLIFFIILSFYSNISFSQKNAPSGLQVNLMSNPELVVLTDLHPTFGWIVPSVVSSDLQTAYQIEVASTPQLLQNGQADFWKSGTVKSTQSINISYKGKALEPTQSYWWRVKTWGKNRQAASWSAVQQFNTAEFDSKKAWPGESKWVETTSGAKTSFWALEDREPMVYHDVMPVKKRILNNGNLLYDFGKDAFAYLTLDVQWDESKKINELPIIVGEKLLGDTIDRKPGGSIVYRKYSIKLKPGIHKYNLEIPRYVPTMPHSQLMPDHMPNVVPFRYCEIPPIAGLKINGIVQRTLYVPYDPQASAFNCSDDRLNQIYDMCKWSTIANTFNGDYANSERERMLYEGDAYIQQMSHYAIDRSYSTARYSTENLIYHATWPTEWILHSVFMAWADYLNTGDDRFIKKYYQELKAKSLIALETPNGLISTRTGLQTKEFIASIHFSEEKIKDIVDWPWVDQGIYPSGETDGYEFKDYNTVVNAFYYRSLQLMQKIALATGHADDALDFGNRSKRVKTEFQKAFFDKRNEIYVDGTGSRHSSLHANMFPLAFDLVPEEQKESVVNYVKSRWMACGVYAANYLMEGLFNANQSKYAQMLMTNDSDRGWMNMIRVGSTMTMEAWDLKYDPPYLSWNHAWSASPVHLIPRRMMGIEPAEPGFGKITIKPQPGDLKWANMKLPTIRGDVSVSFDQQPGKYFKLTTAVPANTTAIVYLPKVSGKCIVTIDGKVADHLKEEGDRIVIPAGSGKHSYEIKHTK